MSTLPGEGGAAARRRVTPHKSVAVRTFRFRFTEFHRNPYVLFDSPIKITFTIVSSKRNTTSKFMLAT